MNTNSINTISKYLLLFLLILTGASCNDNDDAEDTSIPVLISQNINDGDVVGPSGYVELTFSKAMRQAPDTEIYFNGGVVRVSINYEKVRYTFSGMENKECTFEVPAGALTDMQGRAYDEDFFLSFTAKSEISGGGKVFDAIVDSKGNGDYFQELEEGKLSADEFRKQLENLCGRSLTMEETKQAWLGFFNEVNLNKLDYILELRKSYHVYILSNTNPFVMSWACSPDFSSRKKPLNDYCDKLYLSYQVGHTKPAPEIFDYMVNDCNIIPSETLFVDDGASNIQIGKELGFETFQPKNGEDWREKMTAILEK